MKTERTDTKRCLRPIALLAVTVLFSALCLAQTDPSDSIPDDPGSLKIYTVQNMAFGAFTNGVTGGSVIISTSGTRSVTGTVVPLNFGTSYFQAIFDVDAPTGSIISFSNGPDVTLTGSNGGSMTLRIGNANPASPFVVVVAQPTRTQVNIGGTLTVGSSAANPPGSYSGTFSVTFNQE